MFLMTVFLKNNEKKGGFYPSVRDKHPPGLKIYRHESFLAKKENSKNERGIQRYFFRRMEPHQRNRGKELEQSADLTWINLCLRIL